MRSQRVAVLVLASSFFYMMSLHIVRTLLPYLAKDVGASATGIARVIYLGLLMFCAIPPLAGFISDRLGYRRVALVATVLHAGLLISYSVVSTYDMLVAVRIAQAVAGIFLSATFLHIASDLARRSGVYIGILNAARTLGYASGPLVVLLLPLPVRELIVLAGLVALAPLAVVLLSEPPRRRLGALRHVSRAFSAILKREFIPFYLCTFAEILAFGVVSSYIVAELVDVYNLTVREFALVTFVLTSLFGVFSVPASNLADRRPTLSASLGALMIAVSLGLAVFACDLLSLLACLALFEIFSAFAFNPMYVVVSKRLPDSVRGLGINLADVLVNTGFLALPAMEVIACAYGLRLTLVPAVAVNIIAFVTLCVYSLSSKRALRGLTVGEPPT